MKRQIIVTINADEKTCGKCKGLYYGECGMFYVRACGEWVNTVLDTDDNGRHPRCAACLAAEAKAKGEGK